MILFRESVCAQKNKKQSETEKIKKEHQEVEVTEDRVHPVPPVRLIRKRRLGPLESRRVDIPMGSFLGTIDT